MKTKKKSKLRQVRKLRENKPMSNTCEHEHTGGQTRKLQRARAPDSRRGKFEREIK
jgi:hypothetical protein